jgi:hypothetical protein
VLRKEDDIWYNCGDMKRYEILPAYSAAVVATVALSWRGAFAAPARM